MSRTRTKLNNARQPVDNHRRDAEPASAEKVAQESKLSDCGQFVKVPPTGIERRHYPLNYASQPHRRRHVDICPICYQGPEPAFASTAERRRWLQQQVARLEKKEREWPW